MKNLIFKRVLLLAIISFASIGKWWYGIPVDGPDTLLYGFPFPFVCAAWHTSMSLQIFVSELLIDFSTYFSIWFLLLYCIHRFVKKINTRKIVTNLLGIFSGLIIAGACFIASDANNLFYVKRPFTIEIMETGYQFIWQHTERPNYSKYHSEGKK